MASGMDWAMNALLGYLQIDPEQFKGQLANTTQIIVEAKGRLERIEANQLRILEFFKKGNADVNNRDLPGPPPVGSANGGGTDAAIDDGG